VTVAFDPRGRGYLCATRASNTPGGRAMFAYRTDDGGRSFSAPVALAPEGVPMLDHQVIATGAGQTPAQRNVYVAWAGGPITSTAGISPSPAPPTAETASNPRARS
jgi:hypothetical protein